MPGLNQRLLPNYVLLIRLIGENVGQADSPEGWHSLTSIRYEGKPAFLDLVDRRSNEESE